MHAYVVTSQKATAVQNSLICNFTSLTDRNLIITKGNNIEIYTVRESSIELIEELSIYGRIGAITYYRPPKFDRDVLIILTDKRHFSMLAYDSTINKVITRATGNINERSAKTLETGVRIIMDPDYRVVAFSMYQGALKILPIDSPTGLKEAFITRFEMVTYIDMKFLYGCSRPTLCVLYEDNRRSRHIQTYVIDQRDKELLSGPWIHNFVESGAKLLIPVPSPTNGVLVVGDRNVMYLNGSGNIQSAVMDPTQITSFTPLDDQGSRYLLGDTTGQLHVLILVKTDVNRVSLVKSIAIDRVGMISIPESLTFLGNGMLFVGSLYGDSQLIQLHTPAEVQQGLYPNAIEVLVTYPNLGPILDMAVVQTERKGQCRVVTCSGGYTGGSLRVASSGVGIDEQAAMEISGIKGLWSLRSMSESSVYDKFLVMSFVGETRVLGIDNNELGEIEIAGFSTTATTLLALNSTGDHLIQVTSEAIRLMGPTALTSELTYTPHTIVAADSLPADTVIALSGGTLVYTSVVTSNGSSSLQQRNTLQLDQDIACISVKELSYNTLTNNKAVPKPENKSAFVSMDVASADSTVALVAVGMWTDRTVRIFTLSDLTEVTRVHVEVDAQTRSVLLTTFAGCDSVYLFIGLGDGALLYYTLTYDSTLNTYALEGRKKVTLGTREIGLSTFTSASTGNPCLFVTGDRPTVVYNQGNKILFSTVNTHDISHMSSFHSLNFPNCLALTSEEGTHYTVL